jgi:5'-nucleotidase
MKLPNARSFPLLFSLFVVLLLASGCVLPPLPTPVVQEAGPITLEIYHLSDYHSHALPDFAEGEPDRGGIAQTIGLLQHVDGENVLIFNGGDMMNLNNPIWSDEYTCTEWAWLNNLVDGMALGNHEFDYGPEAFTQCSYNVTYPIISAGLVMSETLTPLLPEYVVYNVGDLKVGAFAVTGNDFPRIVPADLIPAGARWLTEAEELARVAEIVEILRIQEEVDLVVSLGHQAEAEDFAMAQAVPGIDLILGTHSHLKQPFQQIEGTQTYYIAPFQYLAYVAHVTATFEDGELVGMDGRLLPINAETPSNDVLEEKVAAMQVELEAKYPERFEVLGEAAVLIDNGSINLGETAIGNFVTDIARQAVDAHAFFSTSSSFRAALTPGPITREDYLTALPYRNTIVTVDMSGEALLELLSLSASRRGSDAFSQISGLRYTLDTTTNAVSNVEILADPTDPAQGYQPLEPAATYRVATTNFQALIAGGYSDLFAAAANLTNTEIDINLLVIEHIQIHSPISAEIDGRVILE